MKSNKLLLSKDVKIARRIHYRSMDIEYFSTEANTIGPDKLEEVQDRFDEAAENKDVNGFIEACLLLNALDCGVVIYKTKSNEVNHVPLSK
jgi:hypothetical protein